MYVSPFRILAGQGIDNEAAHEYLKSHFGVPALSQVTKAQATAAVNAMKVEDDTRQGVIRKLEDRQENELLTDLATVKTGLSLLIINGMTYESRWLLRLIMFFFLRTIMSEKLITFGYFNHQQYGDLVVSDLRARNISTKNVVGYIQPKSRTYIQERSFQRSTNPTKLIANMEKKNLSAHLIKD